MRMAHVAPVSERFLVCPGRRETLHGPTPSVSARSETRCARVCVNTRATSPHTRRDGASDDSCSRRRHLRRVACGAVVVGERCSSQTRRHNFSVSLGETVTPSTPHPSPRMTCGKLATVRAHAPPYTRNADEGGFLPLTASDSLSYSNGWRHVGTTADRFVLFSGGQLNGRSGYSTQGPPCNQHPSMAHAQQVEEECCTGSLMG
ncbi:hypothetical protein MRX96_018343 [Rhipicephalus microplus]